MKKNKLIAIIIFIVALVFLISGFVFNFLDNDKDKDIDDNLEEPPIIDNEIVNEMSCSIEEDDGLNKINYEYKFLYEDDNLKKYSKIITYKYTKETEEAALRYKGEGIIYSISLAENVPGIDISYTDSNFVITNNYIYNLEEIDQIKYQEFSEIFPIYSLNQSVDFITDTLKDLGYTCK